MANENREAIKKFYEDFQTVPGIISKLALSIAEAQKRLDLNYVESLAAFAAILKDSGVGQGNADEFKELFQAIAPSRYQFTETVVEVRADLHAASATETALSGDFKLAAGPVAVGINASYTKRNAYDYRAAALIRTTLHAISADTKVLDSLLKRLKDAPGTTLPEKGSTSDQAIGEALKPLLESAKNKPAEKKTGEKKTGEEKTGEEKPK